MRVLWVSSTNPVSYLPKWSGMRERIPEGIWLMKAKVFLIDRTRLSTSDVSPFESVELNAIIHVSHHARIGHNSSG